MELLENPLRIKVTGKCNRECSFCHKEGGMTSIDDLVYTERLGKIINALNVNLGIKSIAFTGGEPLMLSNLSNVISEINTNTNISKFSLTTNGTIFEEYEYWSRLFSLGLYKVNISMPDIIDVEKYSPSADYANDIFKCQSKTISILNRIGIETKINIVVFNDVLFTKNNLSRLFHFRDSLNSELVLLPNLTNQKSYEYSQKIIDILRNDMRLKRIGARSRLGTSNTIEKYCDSDAGESSNIIFIKSTKMPDGQPFRLESLCGQCSFRKHCQEGFYGIRLEQIQHEYYIRLCIHKGNSTDVLMKFENFMESSVYKEIKTIWTD